MASFPSPDGFYTLQEDGFCIGENGTVFSYTMFPKANVSMLSRARAWKPLAILAGASVVAGIFKLLAIILGWVMLWMLYKAGKILLVPEYVFEIHAADGKCETPHVFERSQLEAWTAFAGLYQSNAHVALMQAELNALK